MSKTITMSVYDAMEQQKEIAELREKLALTENDRDEWKVKAKDLLKENKELKAYKSLYILLKERMNGLIETQERLTLEKNEVEKENKTLKEKLEEADQYVVLQKIRNGEF